MTQSDEIGQLRRIIALYGDALRVIGGYPNYADNEVANWLTGKAKEALAKTDSARTGEIYAQIT